MARVSIVVCDRCSLRNDDGRVATWTVRRGTQRYTGDLCDKCFDEMLRIYRPSALAKARHQIHVIDPDKIPKH